MVAHLQALHAGAHLGDDARALVPAEEGELRGGGTGDDVLVGVAQAGGGELDHDLPGHRVADLDLLDRPLLADAP